MDATLPTVEDARASTIVSTRVAAVASLLFAVCLFWTVASVNVPYEASDAELLAWWEDSDNRFAGRVSSVLAVAAAVLFAIVTDHVRRMPAASTAPAWRGLTQTMGAAFTATLLVVAAFRGVVSHLVDQLGQPLPGTELLRYSVALEYKLLDLPVMTLLALTMVAIGVLSLRTGALPRWTAFVGLAGAAVMLVAVVAQIGAYSIPAALLWAVCLSIALWRQP